MFTKRLKYSLSRLFLNAEELVYGNRTEYLVVSKNLTKVDIVVLQNNFSKKAVTAVWTERPLEHLAVQTYITCYILL